MHPINLPLFLHLFMTCAFPGAGIRVKFKGPEPEWNSPAGLPVLPPTPWAGCHGLPPTTGDPASYKSNCTGRVSVAEEGDFVTLSSSSSPLKLSAGSSTTFLMDLLVTPMRPVNLTQHVDTRYAHLFGNVQTKNPAAGNPSGTLAGLVDLIVSLNATWAILHQGTSLNTFINEPILEQRLPALETFVKLCHEKGVRVKLYFTTRELTNRAPELFAIKSLPNHEVITSGPGGGGSSLCPTMRSSLAARAAAGRGTWATITWLAGAPSTTSRRMTASLG